MGLAASRSCVTRASCSVSELIRFSAFARSASRSSAKAATRRLKPRDRGGVWGASPLSNVSPLRMFWRTLRSASRSTSDTASFRAAAGDRGTSSLSDVDAARASAASRRRRKAANSALPSASRASASIFSRSARSAWISALKESPGRESPPMPRAPAIRSISDAFCAAIACVSFSRRLAWSEAFSLAFRSSAIIFSRSAETSRSISSSV